MPVPFRDPVSTAGQGGYLVSTGGHSRGIVVAAIFYGAQDHIRKYARTYAGGVRFLQPRGPRQIDPKSVASAVVAAVLHVGLVDFG